LNAFLAQHPEGFYASLAKLQLAKIAAEETRVAATENARLAEQERARLAAERPHEGRDQEKAAADAKAAEEQRVAAEKDQTGGAGASRRGPNRQRIATDTPRHQQTSGK